MGMMKQDKSKGLMRCIQKINYNDWLWNLSCVLKEVKTMRDKI